MAVTALNIDVIVSNPEIRNGSPIINGTTIRVIDLVAYHIRGDKLTPEQLAESFRLSLGQVYAALAYYHLHQAEVEAEKLIAELEKQGKVTGIAQDEDALLREAFKDLKVRWPDPTADPNPEVEAMADEIFHSYKGDIPLSQLIIDDRGEV